MAREANTFTKRKTWSAVLTELRTAIGQSHLGPDAASSAIVAGVEKQLQDLYDIYEMGRIEDAEFEERKRRILSQI